MIYEPIAIYHHQCIDNWSLTAAESKYERHMMVLITEFWSIYEGEMFIKLYP